MAKGVFTPTELVEVQVRLEQMWREPQYSKFYKVRGESVRAVLDNQTAQFTELQNPNKKREVSIKWADWCDQTATAVTDVDSCSNEGCDEPDPKSQDYALDTFLEDCFTISDEDFQTSALEREEVIAKGWMAKIRNIIELLNTRTIAKIEANAGVNPFAGDFTVVGNTTNIPASSFNIETVYPYLMQVMALLRSDNAYILDGQNLFQAKILAEKLRLNADGKLDMALFDEFPYYNDILGFSKAGVSAKTYAIDNGAVAIVSRAKYPKTPIDAGNDKQRWSINLGAYGFPELNIDIQYQLTCDSATGGLVHSWKFKLRGLIAVNPITCDEDNTGIQSFTKVADPVPAG